MNHKSNDDKGKFLAVSEACEEAISLSTSCLTVGTFDASARSHGTKVMPLQIRLKLPRVGGIKYFDLTPIFPDDEHNVIPH